MCSPKSWGAAAVPTPRHHHAPLTFWSIGEVQVHPAHFGTGLTGHAGAAAADARAAADDQGQLQDDLLGARDADVDLRGERTGVIRDVGNQEGTKFTR